MNVPLRVLACAVVLFGAVLFVSYALVPWLGGPSLFPDDLHDLCRTILEAHQRGEALEASDRVLLDQLEVKSELAADVIAGRTSLAEAAGEFRRLHERLLLVQDDTMPALAPEVDDEGAARQVIAWVRVMLEGDPRRDVVLDRLEVELGAMIQQRELSGG